MPSNNYCISRNSKIQDKFASFYLGTSNTKFIAYFLISKIYLLPILSMYKHHAQIYYLSDIIKNLSYYSNF